MRELLNPLTGGPTSEENEAVTAEGERLYEESSQTPEEKQYRMANLAVFAIWEFCESLGERLDHQSEMLFHEALRTHGGYFQWTPSNPTFKRITVSNPYPESRPSDWSGNLAVVIDNGSDSVNRALTDRLNTMIKNATSDAWLVDPDI